MHQPDCDKVSLERGGRHHECLRHARPRARADGQTAGTTKRRRRGGSPRWAAPPRRPVPRFTGKEEARALNRTDEGVSGIRERLATLTTEARPGVVTPQAGPPHPGGPGGAGVRAGRSRTRTRGRPRHQPLRAGTPRSPRTGDPPPPAPPDPAHPALAGPVQAAALGLHGEGGAHRGPAGADPPHAEPGPQAAQPPGAQHRAAFPGQRARST